MKSSRLALRNATAIALLLASVALSGCSSTGTLSIQPPVQDPPTIQDPTPVAQSATGVIATNTGSMVSSAGGVVQAVGAFIASTDTAPLGIDSGVVTGLGNAVQQAGNAVDILGTGTGNSLGKTGREEVNKTGLQEADMLAIQLESAPLVVEQVGGAVSSVGDAVAAVDNGQLSALSPVTDPAGALLNQTGAGIASLSGNLTTAMDNAVVQRVTSSGSAQIHRVAMDAEATTQDLGNSTGLGVPVNDLLVGTGSAVNTLGGDITSTFAASPVLSSSGGVVSAAGLLLGSVGKLVTPPASSKP